MTGAELARRLLIEHGIECEVVAWSANSYIPEERMITLRLPVYDGRSPKLLTVAAHEVGHAVQAKRLGWVADSLRWITPGRLWLEWDACQRARSMMTAADIAPDEAVLAAIWNGYRFPAIWQTAAFVAVLIYLISRK